MTRSQKYAFPFSPSELTDSLLHYMPRAVNVVDTTDGEVSKIHDVTFHRGVLTLEVSMPRPRNWALRVYAVLLTIGGMLASFGAGAGYFGEAF